VSSPIEQGLEAMEPEGKGWRRGRSATRQVDGEKIERSIE